jgi:crotonobetainyl-CoA:carnitine CoA-transferase CaiB-like acyl-CoA transferase
MILAGLGADVIKVERIDGGDDARQMGPHLGEWGAVFVPLNRGKRSIAVDLSKPAGRDLILRLASTCDVFVENFRGGKMAALGLDEAAVRAHKNDIIYASLSAFGNRGPDSLKPGYEALAQGRSGIISVTGAGPESQPFRAGVSIVDMSSGMWMAIGIVSALFERQKSGRGQRVDNSLLETGVMLMFNHLVGRQFTGVDPVPQGNSYPSFGPYGAFQTSDGWMMIGVSNDRMFKRLCGALDCPEWISDPRFSTNILRVKNRAELDGELQKLFREKPTAYWAELFDAHNVPVSPIQNAGQVLDDPQVQALGQMENVSLPGFEDQPVTSPRLPLTLSLTNSEVLGPPPTLGGQGREILKDAGYSDAEIAQLIDAKICELP